MPTFQGVIHMSAIPEVECIVEIANEETLHAHATLL